MESIANADSQLTLIVDQIKYAQFWFVKATTIDDIAFNHLYGGNIENAVNIWSKKDNASSLQNRIVCALLVEDYTTAIKCAEILYSDYCEQLVSFIVDDNDSISAKTLIGNFLSNICNCLGVSNVLSLISNSEWIEYLKDIAVEPLIDKILAAIEVLPKNANSSEMYNAGVTLIKETKEPLTQLQKILSKDDLQYQMIADKLGLEILGCGIKYYNNSEDIDSAQKAMNIQSYALKIVVGQMAKDRCKENVDILQKTIDSLPPLEVFAEYDAIVEELKKFNILPDEIEYSVELLENTKPHLQSIKSKLGVDNELYLSISTKVISSALYNLVAEINEAQKEKLDILRLLKIKALIKSAWRAMLMMDAFDMEPEFKRDRYNKNRAILKEMYEQLDDNSTESKPLRSSTMQYYGSSSQTSNSYRNISSHNNTNEDDTNWGCAIPVIIGVIILLIATCS